VRRSVTAVRSAIGAAALGRGGTECDWRLRARWIGSWARSSSARRGMAFSALETVASHHFAAFTSVAKMAVAPRGAGCHPVFASQHEARSCECLSTRGREDVNAASHHEARCLRCGEDRSTHGRRECGHSACGRKDQYSTRTAQGRCSSAHYEEASLDSARSRDAKGSQLSSLTRE